MKGHSFDFKKCYSSSQIFWTFFIPQVLKIGRICNVSMWTFLLPKYNKTWFHCTLSYSWTILYSCIYIKIWFHNFRDPSVEGSSEGAALPTHCPVCQVKTNGNMQGHYGGKPSCFSCRAFFRRAYQKTRNPVFQCKGSGNCAVTAATRRRCQKCRMELCLKIGMKPESVLTNDQVKDRFK